MDKDTELCDAFDAEWLPLKRWCDAQPDVASSGNRITEHFEKWSKHPAFIKHEGLLRVHVLNEAAFLIAEPKFRDVAWQFYRNLAQQAYRRDDSDLKSAMTIALFELIPEPPIYEHMVRALYEFASDPEARWAVFAAYERWPRTFRKHIEQFGFSLISLADYTNWLAAQGLVLTTRGVRLKRHK